MAAAKARRRRSRAKGGVLAAALLVRGAAVLPSKEHVCWNDERYTPEACCNNRSTAERCGADTFDLCCRGLAGLLGSTQQMCYDLQTSNGMLNMSHAVNLLYRISRIYTFQREYDEVFSFSEELDFCVSGTCGTIRERLERQWVYLATLVFILHPYWDGDDIRGPQMNTLLRINTLLNYKWEKESLMQANYRTLRSLQEGALARFLRHFGAADPTSAWPNVGMMLGVRGSCAVGAYGPFDECPQHHPVFWAFPPVKVAAALEGYVTDFLGATLPGGSCSNTDAMNTPSRTIACARHAADPAAQTFWPIPDEEYFQYIGLLAAVLSARDRGRLSIAELGSGPFGPWAARAAAAWRRLGEASGAGTPGPCTLSLVDHKEEFVTSLQALEKQGVFKGCTVEARRLELGEDIASLEEALSGLGVVVDLVDMDIQEAELGTVILGRQLLREHARRLYIGTHSRRIHSTLEHVLREDGWVVTWSFAPLSLQATPHGPISFADGVLAAVRPE